ncbi:hypothetical protein HH219_13120 [Pseudoalteromonas sp. NEC-BIFX-2020_015]|uniref:phosphoribosyltransferase-like protein n=1 Tax=Pseudoalteromonas sp. NEC-BIFX-2020_015 TaxID=2729544 RepID=UPI001461571E|nr:hypothetical protein [Pseudoalteromonas sp. NEC-BIFX-2020_015]NMR26462.1 hypothetical protein [Pseudoalteromonas sp. NEC-BIFX-2020_015]
MNETEFKEMLEMKIMNLSQNVWEHRISTIHLNEWLDNFLQAEKPENCERTHALFLLSNFMYFGVREIRELLKSIYRDKFFNPLIQEVRKRNNDTKNIKDIENEIVSELASTRFLGVGNPSESGTHLLYFFRQENALGKDDFIHTHEILNYRRDENDSLQVSLKNEDIKRYIFIDDVCGSGTQAIEYSEELIKELKNLNPNIKVYYFSLFSTSHGLENIRNNTLFDKVECVFELDNTFKCFSESSRYFKGSPNSPISKEFTEQFCRKYGTQLFGADALGYKDGQLLLGFSHNTPDNSLPIIWGKSHTWNPIFKRYNKAYGTTY